MTKDRNDDKPSKEEQANKHEAAEHLDAAKESIKRSGGEILAAATSVFESLKESTEEAAKRAKNLGQVAKDAVTDAKDAATGK